MSKMHFELSANEAQAVQAFLKLAAAQGKVKDEFKKSSKAGKELSAAVGEVSGSLQNLIGISFGVAGAIAGVKEYIQSLENIAEAKRGFERELRGLFGQGDNINRMKELRSQVLAISSAYGTGTAEAAKSIEDIQEGLGHLGDQTVEQALQASLRLSNTLGKELPAMVQLSTYAFQNFGDQLRDIGQAEDVLAELADAAENPAEMLAALAPGAKAAKVSLIELVATMRQFREAGGRSRETLSAHRELMQGMTEALDQGLLPKGESYISQLKRLSALDPFMKQKIFGKEQLALINQILSKSAELEEKISGMQGDAGGELQRKSLQRLTDKDTANAEALGLAKTLSANAEKGLGLSRSTASFIEDAAFTEAGVKMAGVAGPLQGVAKWGSMALGGDGFKNLGVAQAVEQLKKAGRDAEADVMMVRHGSTYGLRMGSFRAFGDTHPVYTEAAQAERYAEMRASRPYFNPLMYARWMAGGGTMKDLEAIDLAGSGPAKKLEPIGSTAMAAIKAFDYISRDLTKRVLMRWHNRE
jgi:hypothetical protein